MARQKKTLLYIVCIIAVAYAAVCLTAFPRTQVTIVEVVMSLVMLALLYVSVAGNTVKTDDGEQKLSFTVIMASSILAAVQLLFGITSIATPEADLPLCVEVSIVLLLIQALFVIRFTAPKKPKKSRAKGEAVEQQEQDDAEAVEHDDPRKNLLKAMGAVEELGSSVGSEGGLGALMGKGQATGAQAKLQSTISDLQQSMDGKSELTKDQRIDSIIDRLQQHD